VGTLSSELGPFVRRAATGPRIYADANVPLGLVGFMRHELRWDVFFVMEHHDLRRARDVEHYRLARDMRRTLITLDRDYIDDRRFPPAASGGVIVLSAPDTTRLEVLLRRIDTCLLRPGHPDSVLPRTDVSLDCPLTGLKLHAHPNWP
jgi:predicted nuclease of predicted toxin-antitoxin system